MPAVAFSLPSSAPFSGAVRRSPPNTGTRRRPPGPPVPTERLDTYPPTGAIPTASHESRLPVQKTFKTLEQWKEDAQARTADYQRNGFPSPVTWVYVEGHAIPPFAIVGGVDRKGPWNIARSFFEGSLELGKAGPQFKDGACISYRGRERDVYAYEVLVEANLPTRWVYQSPLSPLPLPRPLDQPTVLPDPRPPPRRALADFKLVVVVDDSDSMDGPLWTEARDALAGVAEWSRVNGGEGLDIYCLNNRKCQLGLRNEAEVSDFFNDLVPEGQTPTGARLREILDFYVPKIEDPSLRHKPIRILVITDGVPTDDPKSVIVEYARRLDRRKVPLRQLRIQFVQIGDDPDATDALEELDNQLGPENGVRDMVNTAPFNREEPFHADLIVSRLSGVPASWRGNEI